MNDSMKSRILELREQRIAREKARLDKLREMNIKKYSKDDQLTSKLSASNIAIGTNRPSSTPSTRRPITNSPTRPRPDFKVPDTSKLVLKTKKLLSPSKPPSNVPDILSEVNSKAEPPQADDQTAQKTVSLMNQIGKNVAKKTESSRKSVAPQSTKSMTRKTVAPSLSTLATAPNNGHARRTIVPSEMAAKTGVTKTESRKTIVPSGMTVKTGETKTELRKTIVSSGMTMKTGVTKSDMRRTIVPSEITNKTAGNKSILRQSIVPPQSTKSQARKTMLPSEFTAKAETKSAARKSFAPKEVSKIPSRKSLMPIGVTKPTSKPIPQIRITSARTNNITQSASKANINQESVFDRLYKQRAVNDKVLTNVQKLKTDMKFRDKVIKESNLLFNKRHTTFEQQKSTAPVRRSISAVHFKRIPKSELAKCITKWSSCENVNKTPLKEINEDELVKHDKLVSAVKSERKKVTFQRASIHNGPTTAELQTRLKNWLQKRGKSLDAYHHLQCFGIHHLVQTETENEFKPYDDEDKENISVASDSDDDSYSEAMNGEPKRVAEHKWRRASYVNDFDDTPTSLHAQLTPTSPNSRTPASLCARDDAAHDTEELLNGALNDLTDLLREGFDWEQSARWLRAIRTRFPSAASAASYWECRAALEERQGNLAASLHCWEEAIAKGTERTVVEANLDQLLDKFMKLNISPKSEGHPATKDKLIDVKNVFKSTIIRFAVQQAKLRQSNQHEGPTYTVTPVRRSNRLSQVATPRGTKPHATPRRTPLVQICSSLRKIDEVIGGKAVFVPNATIPTTP